jgi:glutamine synthetase adenylyltransferase
MAKDEDEAEAFIKEFRAELSTISDFAQVVMNSHYSVERDLDDVLAAIFYDPKRLERADLKFMQKVHIARAYTWNMGERSDWQIISELNALRNEVAHRRRNEQANKIVGSLRDKLVVWGTEKFRRDVKAANPNDVVVYAAARCGGFLAFLEDHAKQMRKVLEDAAESEETGV